MCRLSWFLLCLGLGVAAIAREKSPRLFTSTPRNVMRDLRTTSESRPNHPTPAIINLVQDLRKKGNTRPAHSKKRNKSHDFRGKGKSRPDYPTTKSINPIQSLQNTHKSPSAPITAWNISFKQSLRYNETFGKRKWQYKYIKSAKWLPDFSSNRDIRPKWEAESDCLYKARVFSRPYPNDCYKHTCKEQFRRGCPNAMQDSNMKDSFYKFWKEIRGDFMFTFDYVLRFDNPEYTIPIHSYFWYLIAYLKIFVIRIQYPVYVASNAIKDNSDIKSTIDAMINEHKDALANLWIGVEAQKLQIKVIIDGGCPDNQEFEVCPDPCEPQTCKESYEGVDPSCKNVKCEPQCRCKPSYFLNKDKECVLKKDCVLCESDHVPECPSKCPPRQCSQVLSGKRGCKAGPVDLTCKTLPVCQCAPGLYRIDKDRCVDPFMCPNLCPKEQTVEMCPHKCNLKRCNESFPETPCPPTPPDPCPNPTCVCAGNLYLNEDGQCVAKKYCLDCAINQVPECPNSCEKLCVKAPWPDNCKPEQKYPDCTSKPECHCNRTGGFYLHNNMCIPRHECRDCGDDRRSLACTDRSWCAERTAASYLDINKFPHKNYCPTNFHALTYCKIPPQCHCKYPYVNKNGACVKFTETRSCTFGKYKLDLICGDSCDPPTCLTTNNTKCDTKDEKYLADCRYHTCQCPNKDEFVRYYSNTDQRCYNLSTCILDHY